MSRYCENCEWFQRDPVAAFSRESLYGTCRIRSVDGPFPVRRATEWCGEFSERQDERVAVEYTESGWKSVEKP